MKSARTFVLFLCLLLQGSLCLAIDNPDSPDYVTEFEARARSFEINIQNQGLASSDTHHAYFEYEKFLDMELNNAYVSLTKRMTNEKTRKFMVNSQKRWLQFRDAEFQFIADNWTVDNFGTSSVITVGASRTKIIRDRVIELLYYLKNY